MAMNAETVIQLVVIVALIVLIAIGNTSLCVCILVTRDLHTPSGYILASLATADLLVGIWLLPFSIPAVVSQGWTIGEAMCAVNGFTNHVLSVASILGLFVISVDRYVSIFYPLRYNDYITSRTATIMIMITWGYSFVTATLPLVGWGKYTFVKGAWLCVTDFKVSYSFSYFITLSVYGIPLTLMTIMYYRIFRVAYHHSRAIDQQKVNNYGSNDTNNMCSYPTLNKLINQAGSQVSVNSSTRNKTDCGTQTQDATQPRQDRLHPYANGNSNDSANSLNIVQRRKKRKLLKFKKEIRTGLVLSVIVIIFVISWSPFAILNLWALHTKQKPSIASEAVVSRLAYLNSAINPPLYCLMNKLIRKSMKNLWRRIFRFFRIDKYFKCFSNDDKETTVLEFTAR